MTATLCDVRSCTFRKGLFPVPVNTNYKLIFAVILVLLVVFLNSALAAEISPSEILDNLTTSYQSTLQQWKPKMQGAAKTLLISLGTINIVWRAAQLLFRGNNIADLIWEVVRTIAVIGFFLWLIGDPTIGGTPLYQSLFDSMANLAGQLTGSAISKPSDCVQAGFDAFSAIMDATPDLQTDGFFGTMANAIIWLAYILSGLVIGCITLLFWIYTAVQMVIVTVSFTFLLYGGLLILGLAGTEWTRNSALSYLNAIIASSLRYFATIAVATMSYQVMVSLLDFSVTKGGMDANFGKQLTALLMFEVGVLSCGFITYLMVNKLPDMLANLVSPAGSGIGVSASQGLAAAKLASAATGLTAAAAAVGGAAKSMAGSAGKSAVGAMDGALSGAVGGVRGAYNAARNGESLGGGFANGFKTDYNKGISGTSLGAFLGDAGKALARNTGHATSQFRSDFEKLSMDKATAAKAAKDANKMLQQGGNGGYYAIRKAMATRNGVSGSAYDQLLQSEAQSKPYKSALGSNGVTTGNEEAPKADGSSSAAKNQNSSFGSFADSSNTSASSSSWSGSGDTFNPTPQNGYSDHDDPYTDIPGRDPIGNNLNESWDNRPGNINK